MAKPKNSVLALPDNLVSLLASADKRNGLPPGTMQAVMQQEAGGNLNKYLQDPSAYHYGLNAEGKRVAEHTGKVSTAFGPFGILESTAAKPGFGVAPLKNKSIEEQVRFASDYLAARSKKAGGLIKGLAGYGEGGKYATQVAAKMGGKGLVAAGKPAKGSKRVAEGPVQDDTPVLAQAVPTAPVVPADEAPVEEVPYQVAEAKAVSEDPWGFSQLPAAPVASGFMQTQAASGANNLASIYAGLESLGKFSNMKWNSQRTLG